MLLNGKSEKRPGIEAVAGLVKRANALHSSGRLRQAVELYLKAIETGLCDSVPMAQLGFAFEGLGQYQEALRWYGKAVENSPRFGQAWLAGGILLARLARLKDAVDWLQQAVGTESSRSLAMYNLARIYRDLGRTKAARTMIKAYLASHPGDSDGWNSLGTVLLEMQNWKEAGAAFEEALRLDPKNCCCLLNLALVKRRQGKLLKALALAERSKRMDSQLTEATALQAQLLQQTFQWERLAKVLTLLKQESDTALSAGLRPAEPPFLNFTWNMEPGCNLAVAKAWSDKISRRARQINANRFFRHYPGPRRRLSIGYLSGQFNDAATGHLTRSMFQYHDRSRFRIICYSLGGKRDGIYTAKIARDAEAWVELGGLDDLQAAATIHNDKVDILVDMTGHMDGNRLGICALRPAPVQVHYLGYPATTGADFIDYFIVDKVVVPEGQQSYYSEKLVYLPGCYQVNDDDPPIAGQRPVRSEQGLPEKAFVFCSFNTEYKLDSHIFNAWLTILRQTENSVLWLMVRNTAGRKLLQARAGKQGVDPKRLVFATPMSKPNHLARLSLADLALDTRIVNGHTTTADALQVGLPVVTIKGNHFASRVSASLLEAAGIAELIAEDLEQYVNLAVSLAGNRSLFQKTKRKLAFRNKLALFNTSRTVALLEKAYCAIWQRYLEGRPPDNLQVNDLADNQTD